MGLLNYIGAAAGIAGAGVKGQAAGEAQKRATIIDQIKMARQQAIDEEQRATRREEQQTRTRAADETKRMNDARIGDMNARQKERANRPPKPVAQQHITDPVTGEVKFYDPTNPPQGMKVTPIPRAPRRPAQDPNGPMTEQQKRTFLGRRIEHYLTVKYDRFGDPVPGTGLSRDEATKEAQRDLAAMMGQGEPMAPTPGDTPKPGTASPARPAASPTKPVKPLRQPYGAPDTTRPPTEDPAPAGAPEIPDEWIAHAGTDPEYAAYLRSMGINLA